MQLKQSLQILIQLLHNRKKSFLILLILVGIIFIGNIGLAQSDTTRQIAQPDKYHRSAGLAMLLSAVIPGGGQFYCKNYWKTAIFVGAEGVLGYYAYQYHRENQKNKRDNLLWWLASVKLLSIADAYVTANMYKFKEQMKLSYDAEPGNQIVSVGLQTKLKLLDK